MHETTETQAQPPALSGAAIAALQGRVRGAVITPGHPLYEEARRIWNRMIDRRPAVIVRCSGAEDVARAIRFARANDLPIAVRGGGHSTSGSSAIDGGLVIDLSQMKGVAVDAGSRSAWVQPGLKLGELIRTTEAHGFVVPVGTASDTGIAGLTLGGGMGWLTGKLGLTVDNMLGFEVVLATGEVVRASEHSHPDLFWALRGGSGNFGVVTAFHYRLSEVGTVLGGMVVYPYAQARDVLRFYRDYTLYIDDNVTAYAGILSTPDGHPAVAIALCATGPQAQAERQVEAVRRFGTPVLDTIQPLSYEQMVGLLDPASPPGFNYYVKANAVQRLSNAAIEAVLKSGAARTTPRSAVVLQHFHGAATRVPATATAFSQRFEHFDVMYLAGWTDGDDGSPHIDWVRRGVEATKPFAEEGIYVNFLGAGETEERIRASYGPNYERLAAIKRQYDPENLFQRNPNVRPARPDAEAAA